MAAVHGEQVVYRDSLEVVGYLLGKLVREEIHELVSDLQQAGIDGHAHGSGRERLADGVHGVGLVRSGIAVPTLIDYLAVLEYHEALEEDGIVGFVAGQDGVYGLLDGCRRGGAGEIDDLLLLAAGYQQEGRGCGQEDK